MGLRPPAASDGDGRRPWTAGGAARRLAFRLLALSVGVGLPLIALEIVLWAFAEPGGGWYAAGPQRLEFLARHVHRNADGFRDREFRHDATPGLRRILAVGDSFTFGDGVARVEDTWPRVLEHDLREAGVACEVYNVGVPGADTEYERDLLRSFGYALHPTDVVVGFVLNDVEPPDAARRTVHREVFLPLLPIGGLDDRLTRVSYAYSWLRARKNAVYGRFGWSRSYTDYLHGLYDDARTWDRFADQARALVAEARAHGARVTVVLFPFFGDMPGYTFDAQHARVADLFRRAGADVVDLLDRYRAFDVSTLQVSPQDAHPNEAGHRLAAAWIAERLAGGTGGARIADGD